jgi:hypothetical protein
MTTTSSSRAICTPGQRRAAPAPSPKCTGREDVIEP